MSSTPDVPPLADPDFAPTRGFPVRESALLIAAAVFQLLILAGMIAAATTARHGADRILVQVIPLDPRDMFRGEYVTLSYAFSQVPAEGVEGLPGPYTTDNQDEWQGRAVFVPLTPIEGREDRYTSGPPSVTPPPNGVPFLQGTLETPSEIDYGIETFYVQEGGGPPYEEAARERKLWAELAVSRHGHAGVTGLVIDQQPTPAEPSQPRP